MPKKVHRNLGKKSALNSSNISKEKRTKKVLIKVHKLVPKKSALPKNSASNSANISNDLLKVPKIVPNKVPKIVTSY